MTTLRINPAHPPIEFAQTTPRVTDASNGQRFRDGLASAARVVLNSVESVASFIPGSAVLTAALRSDTASASPNVGAAGAALSSTSATAEAPSSPASETGLASLAGSAGDQNMQFLRMQEQLQAENRRYSALSNALKARHETAKNSINNIR
ncbi:MAG: hypothetical protein IPK60_11945 [Sandaracinaceae bacterium]|jgi:hypothetical protein|nr:hypothetical protein [Sandaracinaceae bacterium]